MFYKVKAVRPLPDYFLSVLFESGAHKRYDVKPLFDRWESFQALATVKGLFDQVSVDAGGYGVSWNDDIDLSCDELYHNGVEVGSKGDITVPFLNKCSETLPKNV